MLNSRYVHLHDALGLGPMWLDRRAEIRRDTPQNSVSGSLKTAEQALPASEREGSLKTGHTPQTLSHAAHGSALERLRRRADEAATPPAAPTLPAEGERQPETTPARRAKVMVMSVCPSLADAAAGQLFSGEDGVLLDKMLAAIGLEPEEAYRSTWLKNLPDFNPYPDAETVAAAAGRVAQEWHESGAQAMLLLGDFFQREEVRAHLAEFAPEQCCFHIAHPLRIAGNPKLKRAAWETLQTLRQTLAA